MIIPIVMPKPDLLAPTGGYRKTPVLQIGADVFEPFPRVRAWGDRVTAIGHGTYDEVSPAAAIEVARAATPQTGPAPDAGDLLA